MNRLAELPATLAELLGVLRVLRLVESARRKQGPRPLLEELRQRGARAPERDAVRRRCLRRAIAWVDRCLGANCFRRALLETALDRGAAREPVSLGFHAGPARLSGHAWLDADEQTAAYHFALKL
jgi:hypothetical protein